MLYFRSFWDVFAKSFIKDFALSTYFQNFKIQELPFP